MTYYLDTDICIFELQGRYPAIKNRMEAHSPDQIKIPAVVKAELLVGAYHSSNPKHVYSVVERFLDPYEIVSFDDTSAVVYSSVRFELEKKGHPIGPNDLLIAATVLSRHGTLVTHNTHEFNRVPGLKIQDWTE